MRRRDVMQRAVAALCAAGLPFGALIEDAFAASALRRLGTPTPFDYAKLKGTARQLANAAYRPRPDALPPAIAALTYDQWQSIRYRNEESLWAGRSSALPGAFLPLGLDDEEAGAHGTSSRTARSRSSASTGTCSITAIPA